MKNSVKLPAFPPPTTSSSPRLIKTHTLLRDGTHILIRPVHPKDPPALKKFFDGLSEQSRFLRFLSSKPEISNENASRLTKVDYHQKMAFVATVRQNGDEIIVGEARYIPMPDTPDNEVEFAIAVADDYQHLGLGTALMWWLITYARQESIEIFVGLVHPSNQQMLRFLHQLGLPVVVRWDAGTHEVKLSLIPPK